jgi:hypothetical protein
MFLSLRVLALAFLLTGPKCVLLKAQNVVSAGAISGRVTDSSGAVVAGAALVVSNLQTGVTESSVTNRAGSFRFGALAPGTYSLSVSHNGFRPLKIDQISVRIGNASTQDIKLKVGPIGDAITVMAANLSLRPTESSVTSVVERSFLEDLPLNGRRYTDFTLLSPNTSADGPLGLVSIAGQQGGEDSGYANGNGTNSFTVDGTSATNNYWGNTQGGTRIPYTFGEDAIQEFQVAENPYSAIYGAGGTGFINTVTRSGNNNFHGTAFYYNRNSATASNDAIDRASGFPKPQDALQQFGGAFGGHFVPIVCGFLLITSSNFRTLLFP